MFAELISALLNMLRDQVWLEEFEDRKLLDYPDLLLHIGDGLPDQICQQCIHQVNNSYNFRLKCEKSDLTLRQILNSKESQSQSSQEPQLEHAVKYVKPETISQLIVTCGANNSSQRSEFCNTSSTVCPSNVDVTESSLEPCSVEDDVKLNRQIFLNVNEDIRDSLPISIIDNPTETSVQDMLPCDICGKIFTRKSKLKEHVMRHLGGRPHVCQMCGKRFTERSSLKKHTFLHSGQKSHVCDVCGKRFSFLNHLKTHALIHTGQKSHVCDVCGKRFSQLGSFRTHALLHTGEKPFDCGMCGKSFAQKNTLKIHIAAHAGQRPYVCDICGKSFAQSAHLKTHAIVHSGQKRFSCCVCGANFSRKHNLKKHEARHNGQ